MLTINSSAVQTGISAPDIGARISANGRYVAFASNQSLLPNDTTLADSDIYLKDMQTGALSLVSSNADGLVLAGVKTSASLTAGGTVVSFQNTVGPSANIMVKYLANGALVNASTDAAGTLANGASYNAVLSGDARYVAFISKATNLAQGDTNERDDVFVKNLLSGAVVNASATAAGQLADAPSADTAISSDGRTVAFTTVATNLAAGDENYADIYVKNLNTSALTRASTDSTGAAANGNSDNAALSGNGRYIVFTSQASNLVAGDSNAGRDVFRKDMLTGATVRVSVGADGQQGLGNSSNASVSDNGRYVLFESTSNFTPGDADGRTDIFIKDLDTGALARLSGGGDDKHYNYASVSGLASDSLDAVFVTYQALLNTTSDVRTIMRSQVGSSFGSLASENVTGSAGNDNISTGQGRDRISGQGGNDVIDAGGGVDTMVYAGARAEYKVTNTNTGGTVVEHLLGSDGIDVLGNVERVQFADASLALDIHGHAGQAYRMFQAAFDRAPKLAGQGFWTQALDNGVSLETIAGDFLKSPEGQALYGVAPTNAEAVMRFFQNVLHREPLPAGYNFWLDALDRGLVTQASVLAQFAESPENQAQVVGSIQNGILYTPYG